MAGDVSGFKLPSDTEIHAFVSAVASSIIPQGNIYVQLPGVPEPSVLWSHLGFEWENISSQYAGDFFRVDGGNAEPFGGSEQSQGTAPNGLYVVEASLTGQIDWGKNQPDGKTVGLLYSDTDPTGVFQRGDPTNWIGIAGTAISGGYKLKIDASHGHTLRTTNAETRPVNKIIRIWRRK